MTKEYDPQNFGRFSEERDEEIRAIHAELEKIMSSTDYNEKKRLKNIRLKTTMPAIRERVLKINLMRNMDELQELSEKFAKVLFKVHKDEVELGIVMDQRRQAASDYWKRLADGRVYAGARQFLDLLDRDGIDAESLASLNAHETHQINSYIQSVLLNKNPSRKRR
ncbi:hypothetical protein ACX0GZ_12460 [Sphingomonas aestuarii]